MLNHAEAPNNAYASITQTPPSSNQPESSEKLPQRENIYGAPEFSRGSIVNPNNNGKLEDYEVDPRYILEVYKRDVSDPTYGYFKSGNEWHKIYFDPNYKSSSYQGAYFHVRPYQERSGTASQFPITLNYNQFSRINPATLTILLGHVNALFATLPNPGPPGQDLNSRPMLTIYSGAYQDLTASGRAQALQDCEQIRAYLALYFPAADFNILMAERSTYGSVWGTFTVPTGAVGFEFTVKINKFGF
jgi:hypothetical protein